MRTKLHLPALVPVAASLAAGLAISATSAAETPKLTLADDQRPEWLRRDGIVMAGSWEPLLFRVRRDGAEGYTPTAEQRAAYEREHSPAMVATGKPSFSAAGHTQSSLPSCSAFCWSG